MMTPQEVAASTFPKATLGGYNMAAVDVFLDKLTEDYTELYKENATLKSKMKVLVDKMEEYHAMEDTMRSTLLTAQKMANNMITEAEEKRAALLADAEDEARARIQELTAGIAAEEQRLAHVREEIDQQIAVEREEIGRKVMAERDEINRRVAIERERLAVAQRELSAFINGAKALCTRQLEFIARLGDLDIAPVEEPSVEEPVAQEPQNTAPVVAQTEQVVAIEEPMVEEAPLSDAPVEELSPEAMQQVAEIVEELGGDASSLMESMRNVIDLFSNDSEGHKQMEPANLDGFQQADKLFDEGVEKVLEDPFDHYDEALEEEPEATRVLNLNDLQFGRNYTKS